MATPTYNPELKTKADLIAAGYKGYEGWNDEAAILANYKDTAGEGKYTGGSLPNASSLNSDSLPSYLDDYQTNMFNSVSSLIDKIPTADELKASLTPETPKPELLDRTKTFEDLRATHGVSELESDLNKVKEEERLILTQLRELTGNEEGKPVALSVMSGRVSEAERQARTRLDYINVQKATLVDELNTKYNVINLYMNFADLDYKDAVAQYEREFNQNVQMQQLMSGFRQEAWTYTTDAIKLNEQIKQNAIDNARANLATVINAITAGNMDYGSMSADQKLLVQKLEIQSGLPAGIIAQMKEKVDPQADIVFTTSNEGVTQIGFRNPDGTIRVESYGTRTSGGGTAGEREAQAKNETLNKVKAAAAHGATLNELISMYAGTSGVTATDVYEAYNSSSSWGYAKESPYELAKLGVKTINNN